LALAALPVDAGTADRIKQVHTELWCPKIASQSFGLTTAAPVIGEPALALV
jgi:hypothetical protein